MFLSDRDLKWNIQAGRLIVEPRPEKYDSTSIDLHLDSTKEARVWDLEGFNSQTSQGMGRPNELRVGQVDDFRVLSADHTVEVPEDPGQKVFRRGSEIVVKPGGFLLWQTKEKVGTPEHNADLICFVNAKSTRARAGLMVHLTAPTIHASWNGKITLEIANLGPFNLVMEQGDTVAQITVAKISSVPELSMASLKSQTINQDHVTGEK